MDASFKKGKVPKSPLANFHATSTPTTENPPSFFSKEVLITSFRHAASQGERKQIKKLLKKGVPIDACSGTGQTALFLACHNGHLNVVEILLANGANPNVRCCDEATAMHAASFSGNINIMLMLIEAGGDLRLHDKHNRSVAEWAVFNHDEKKQKKMVQFLKKAQSLAVSTTSKGSMTGEKSFAASLRPESTRGTLFRKKAEAPPQGKSNLWQTGFGKMCGDGQHVGLLGLIPLVPENQLRHDDFGITYNNGPFMVMESMQWIHTAVTVKRLHKDPPLGGKVDLLINECETISRLRHPHLLLLMGVCQTNYMESLVLLYERIGCGSLFTYLYQKNENIEVINRCDIVRQVCEAVVFLHHQHLLHTAITSHAVQLITPNQAKLSNLEYMVPISSDGSAAHTSAVNNHYPNAVYNWMAPEVMAGDPPQAKSDLYSVCCLLWELMESMPPMSGMQVADIRERLLTKQTRVFVRQHITEPYKTMLHYGLALQSRNRLVTLEWIRDALTQVIMEKESSLIQNGEMHRRQSRYLPRYQNSHHELTTTDEESTSDTITDSTIADESTGTASVGSIPSQRISKTILHPLNSTVASSTLVDISEQYSLDDIDGVMLSPEGDAPTPRPMNRDLLSSTVKSTPPSTGDYRWSRSTIPITRQSTSSEARKPSTSSMARKPSTSSVISKRSSSNTTTGSSSATTRAPSPAVHKQKEEPPHSDSLSQASGDSFHTVLEMPVAAVVAPPRDESLKLPASMEASTTRQSSSATSQDVPSKKSSSASSRKKFFRSMRRRSSGSSISSTEGSSKSKGSSSSKSSKLSLLKSVMGKRSNNQQQNDTLGDITIDISGISKRDNNKASTVREPTPPPVAPITKQQTPPASDKDEKGSVKSSEQSSPLNPFKKYTTMEINPDDIISEEVKAILARPRKILKLPSFYEKRPPPRTVTGTLLYQYSGSVAFPQPPLSPPSPAPEPHQAPPAAGNPPAVTVRRRSATTIGPSAQASWMDTSLTTNLSLPVAAALSNTSSISLTESCPKLSTTAPEPVSQHSDDHNVSIENSSYKPASRLVPSPNPPKVTPEPANYHMPTPSPRKRLTEEGHTPSPIAPVRRKEGVTLQRSSTTVPARTSGSTREEPVRRREGPVTVQRSSSTVPARTGGSIKEEWLQAYAGAAAPPGVTQDPFLKYRAARRASNRYRSILHEAMSEQSTVPTQSHDATYREVHTRSSSYHSSPSVPPQRTGAQGAVDFSSKGPIKNIIASFQGKLEEHIQKQAILQLKKRTPSKSTKDTFTSETFHTPNKGRELKIPQCSDEQLQLSLEGGPSYRIITPGTTVSTANITLQKTVPLKKPVPSPRTSHKQAFADSLRHIEQTHVEKQHDVPSATSMTYTPRSMESTAGGDSDSSGSELSDYIGRVLSSCHQSVVEKYKHPSCQHLPSMVQKHSSSSHVHEYGEDGGMLHRSPAHTTRAGLLLTNNDNSNNSTSASSTRCASDTGLRASGRRSESEMSARSEGSRQRSIEEFYFDDELRPGIKSRYLNLENSSYTTSTDVELESFLQGDGLDFKTPPVQTPVSLDDYDGTPYKTLDITDYKKFKQERKITRLTEDESGNSEDLIVTV